MKIKVREILFKGKAKDTGEWVQGYIYKVGEKAFILRGLINEALIEVEPETVSQYTELKDKNGVDIWENDLLRYSYYYPGSPWLAQKGMTDDDIRYDIGAVFWQEWRGSWAVCGWGKCRDMNQDVFTYCRNPNRTEVIGNIFDNPELIEKI